MIRRDLINVTPSNCCSGLRWATTDRSKPGTCPHRRQAAQKLSSAVTTLFAPRLPRPWVPAAAMVNYLALGRCRKRLRSLTAAELRPLFDIAASTIRRPRSTPSCRASSTPTPPGLPVTGSPDSSDRSSPPPNQWADRFRRHLRSDRRGHPVRAETLAEVPAQVDFLFRSDPDIDEASWTRRWCPGGRLDRRGHRRRGGVAVGGHRAASSSTFALADRLDANRREVPGPDPRSRSGDGPSARRCSESMEVLGCDGSCAGESGAGRPVPPAEERSVRCGRARAHGAAGSVDSCWLRCSPWSATWCRPSSRFCRRRGTTTGSAATFDRRAPGAAQYDGTPSPVLVQRLDHALDLYRDGVAGRIVLTGGKRAGDRFTEAYYAITAT